MYIYAARERELFQPLRWSSRIFTIKIHTYRIYKCEHKNDIFVMNNFLKIISRSDVTYREIGDSRNRRVRIRKRIKVWRLSRTRARDPSLRLTLFRQASSISGLLILAAPSALYFFAFSPFLPYANICLFHFKRRKCQSAWAKRAGLIWIMYSPLTHAPRGAVSCHDCLYHRHNKFIPAYINPQNHL